LRLETISQKRIDAIIAKTGERIDAQHMPG
jgi:hypothetical protein